MMERTNPINTYLRTHDIPPYGTRAYWEWLAENERDPVEVRRLWEEWKAAKE